MALESWQFVPTATWPLGAFKMAEYYESGEGSISHDSSYVNTVYEVDDGQRLTFVNDLIGYTQYISETTGNYTLTRTLPEQHPEFPLFYAAEASFRRLGKPSTTYVNGRQTGVWTAAQVTGTFRPLEYNVLPESSLDQIAIGDVPIDAGGNNYVVGDVLTVSGGTQSSYFGAATTLLVTATGAGGSVADVQINNPGRYFIPPTPAQSTTGGTGTGCEVTVTYYADEKVRYVTRKYDYVMEQLSATGFMKFVSRPKGSNVLDTAPSFTVNSQQVDYTWIDIPARITDKSNNQPGTDVLQFLPPNLATAVRLGGCVNSAYFDGRPPGTVLYMGYVPRMRKPVLNTGRYLWDLTYRFVVKDQGAYDSSVNATAPLSGKGLEIGCNFIFDVVNYRWDLVTTTGNYGGASDFTIYPSADLNQLFVITQTSQGV